jgi:hypothetical protein
VSDRIDLQQLREHAERGDAYIFGWDHDDESGPIESKTLLALIDAAEAARDAVAVIVDWSDIQPIDRLECALARFTSVP